MFYDEIMTAVQMPISVVSGFTLALLKDSGWYEVNFNLTEKLRHGAGKNYTRILKNAQNNLIDTKFSCR